MSIADDIQKARDAGHSDDDILTAVSKLDPTYGQQIQAAREAKHSPADILGAVQKFDSVAGPEASRSVLDKVTAPFRQGIASAAEGYKNTAHETGNDGAVSSGLDYAAKQIAPKNYTPAHVTLNPTTWGDVPKAVAESLPGMAPDLAAGAAGATIGGAVGGPFAPITAPIGGLIGATGSYLLRNYGNDARGAAIARGGGDNSELTAGDKARALLQGAAGGLMSRLSLGALGSPVKAEAGSMASQLVPQFAKGAAIDAGTSVAQEASHQALIDQKLDLDKLGGAGVTGVATGAGMRGTAAVKDVVAANRFAGADTSTANPLANDLRAVESPHKVDSGEDSFHRVATVSDRYQNAIDATLGSQPIKDRLAALKEHDPLDPTGEAIANVKDDIKAGRTPAQDDLALIHNRLGDVETNGPGLADLFNRQDMINQLKSKGNYDEKSQTFTGGVSSMPFVQNVINPLGKVGKYADVGALTYAALGQTLPGMHIMHAMADPASAIGLPLAQSALYAGARGFDALTGNRNPLKQFTDRFSGGDSADTSGVAPGSSPNGTGPQNGADIARAVALARESGALNQNSTKEAERSATILARDARSNAEFINRQRDREAAQAAKESARGDKTVANHERGDAEYINRQRDRDAIRSASEAARANRVVANHERGDAEYLNRQRDTQQKVVANHERGDAEKQNREVDAVQRLMANHERGDADLQNRQRDQSAKVVANHERGDAELQNRQIDQQGRVVANHERGDADTINRKRDATARTQASAAQSLDKQRSSAYVREQTTLERNAQALDRQRSAAMGKAAETEFNGPKEDASLRIRVAKYKQDLEARREATALQAQKAQAKELAAQAKLDAKRKPAAEGKASASPAEVSLAQSELQSAIKEARVATKAAGKAKADHQKAKSDAPETTPIVTDHGTRMQPIDEIRVSKRAIANGIMKRAGTRANAMSDSLTTLPLSTAGHHYMIGRAKDILDHSFDSSDSHGARDHIESVLDGLSRPDAKIVRDHLKNAGYYKSWKG